MIMPRVARIANISSNPADGAEIPKSSPVSVGGLDEDTGLVSDDEINAEEATDENAVK